MRASLHEHTGDSQVRLGEPKDNRPEIVRCSIDRKIRTRASELV
jgi:hypothetical protein